MSEPRVPHARGGKAVAADSDDIVAKAFATYRADAISEFAPPSASALMAKADRPPRRRALRVSVAALACTGLMVAGVAVAQSVTSPSKDSPEVIGADDGSETSGVEHLDTTGAPGTPSATVPATADPVETELRSLTISLPAWPGQLAERCPAGDYVFTPEPGDGIGSPGASASPPADGTAGETESWELLPGGSHAMRTNLDGENGDEFIVPVACGGVPGVIALSQRPEAFDAVEFVFADTAKKSEPIVVVAVDEAVVTLSFPPDEPTDATLRQFTFNGEQFTETTTDDNEPSTDPSKPANEPSQSPSPGEPSTGGTEPGDSNGTRPEGADGTRGDLESSG